ncbi:MAG: O-antigen ligase family protein [Candidatus Falkowbacteria bacterium]
MIIIIILLALAYLALAIYNLEWAVLLLVFALPSYLIRFTIWHIPSTVLELMLLISFVVFFVKDFKARGASLKTYFNKAKTKRYPFRVEIVLFLLVAYLALAVAGFSNDALGIFKAYFLEAIIFYILYINIFKEESARSKVYWSLAASALIISLFGIYQKLSGQFFPTEFLAAERRVTSFFPYPNAVGLYLAPIVLLLGGFIVKLWDERKNKIDLFKISGLSFVVLISLLTIFLAQSEGALAGIAVAVFACALILNKTSRYIALGCTTVFIIILMISPVAWNYVKTKAMLNDLTGQIRKEQWIETKKMFFGSPKIALLGTGLNNYQASVAPYHQAGIFLKNDDPNWLQKIQSDPVYRAKAWQPTEIYMYPHNIFLNFWTELGVLGMLLFVWIFGRFFVESGKLLAWKNVITSSDRALLIGLTGAMIVVIIHGLVDVPYFKNDLALLFWLLIAQLGLFKIKYLKK